MKKSSVFLSLAISFFLSACSTSLGTQQTATYLIPDESVALVFTNAVKSVVSSGLTIISTDADVGIISAEGARNAVLTFDSPKINIIVSPSGSGSVVTVNAIVGGQVYDYGSSQNAIAGFCNSFRGFHPSHVSC